MSFHPDSVWFLLMLPLVAVAFVRSIRSRTRPTIAFSSLAAIEHAPAGRMARLLRVLPILRACALFALIVAIARPVIPSELTKTIVEGIAIEMVIDRSDSMRALDFSLNGVRANRLDALKDVASRFVQGGEGFAGRPNDLVGAITFARNADSVVPLTLDHGVVLEALAQIDFPEDGSEMGTAIGDAIALGVDKLKDAAEHANRSERVDAPPRISSKVLLILTDGESNCGDLSPQEAAALALSTDVKIYAIGLGTEGVAPVPVRTPFGIQMQNVPVSIDEKTLTEISTATGGKYFRATDSESLIKIYETIDALEKSRIDETKQVRYRDLAVEGVDVNLPRIGSTRLPSELALVLLLLATEILLASTKLRTLA